MNNLKMDTCIHGGRRAIAPVAARGENAPRGAREAKLSGGGAIATAGARGERGAAGTAGAICKSQ